MSEIIGIYYNAPNRLHNTEHITNERIHTRQLAETDHSFNITMVMYLNQSAFARQSVSYYIMLERRKEVRIHNLQFTEILFGI